MQTATAHARRTQTDPKRAEGLCVRVRSPAYGLANAAIRECGYNLRCVRYFKDKYRRKARSGAHNERQPAVDSELLVGSCLLTTGQEGP